MKSPLLYISALATAGAETADFLTEYSEASRAVAAREKVPLIDLNARSIELMNQIGPEAAKAYDPKAKDSAHPDKTHLTPKGAEEISKLVADEIRRSVPELANLLNS